MQPAAAQVADEGTALGSQEADGIYLYDKRFQIPFIPCPRKLDLPYQVKAISCGAHHSLVLTDIGQIFGCGLANDGQLGLIETTLQGRVPPCNLLYPTLTHVPLQSATGIIQLSCGD